MFEYSYNPRTSLLNKQIKFSMKDMQKIADITSNLWEDNDRIENFLEHYDNPFWHIWCSKTIINIEIHADLNALDKSFAKTIFGETVNNAVRHLLETNFANTWR